MSGHERAQERPIDGMAERSKRKDHLQDRLLQTNRCQWKETEGKKGQNSCPWLTFLVGGCMEALSGCAGRFSGRFAAILDDECLYIPACPAVTFRTAGRGMVDEALKEKLNGPL